VRALETCLGALPAGGEKGPPIPMLELLYERCLAAGEHVELPEARACLSAVKGKGKGAKLAGLLLALSSDGSAEHRLQVGAQMLRSRLERYERWQARLAAAQPAAVGQA